MIALSSSVSEPDRCRFRILEQLEQRSDLERRRETKFVCERADIAKIRSVLRGNCEAVRFNGGASTVRSIYFDDPLLTACRENIDGIGVRQKLRLRWYDSLPPPAEVFLELKWRRNLLTGKHRFHLLADTPLAGCSYRELHEALAAAVPPNFASQVVRRSEPIVLIEYRREHFVARDMNLRITVDYAVKCYDQTGKRSIDTRFPMELGDLVVIEGKTAPDEAHLLQQALRPLRLRANKCSKYVRSCHLLGLVDAMA